MNTPTEGRGSIMQIIYNDSNYCIQPYHIDVSKLNGIDKSIISLCQARSGWFNFSATEIGWNLEDLSCIEKLTRVHNKFFLTDEYIRHQFALSPSVDSTSFLEIMQAAKRLQIIRDNKIQTPTVEYSTFRITTPASLSTSQSKHLTSTTTVAYW